MGGFRVGVLLAIVAMIVLSVTIQPVMAQQASATGTKALLRSVGTAMPYYTTPYFTFFNPVGKSGIILAEQNRTAIAHVLTDRFVMAFPPFTQPLSDGGPAPALTIAQQVNENAYYYDTYTFSDELGTFL